MKVTSSLSFPILFLACFITIHGNDFKPSNMSGYKQRLMERVKLGTLDERVKAIEECGVDRPAICYYVLIELLSDESVIIRERSALSVGLMRNTDALPHIQKALDNEKDEKVQISLIRALSFLKTDSSSKIAEKFLTSKSDAIRFNVAKVLIANPDESLYTKITDQIKVENSSRVRVMLLHAALKIKKTDAFIKDLVKYFYDTDPIVRLYSAKAATDLKMKDTLLPLHKALVIEPDPEVSEEFSEAYNATYIK